ncbi:MAG: pyruvate dehydrogenase complex dihydrolipoamide acetyltransferase [Caulobacteraceae bacterium]|nr:pyruvate dehydrogenase complex dihydrolipoamide acetyltransferase [Caulobacteraceae bacterium]
MGMLQTFAPAGASPLARTMAQALGLDLSQVQGSGPQGRVRKADLDSAPGVRTAAPTAPSPSQSRLDIPHFSLSADLEVGELKAARARINGRLAGEGLVVSLIDLAVRAAAVALRQTPEANATYAPDGIAMHHHADIAVDDGGPARVVRAADTKGVRDIARALRDAAPGEATGATFALTDLGAFGVKGFGAVLSPPCSAALSLGAEEARAVVRDDAIVMTPVITATLTCDHRAMDGVIAARFLAAFKRLVEEPLLLMV